MERWTGMDYTHLALGLLESPNLAGVHVHLSPAQGAVLSGCCLNIPAENPCFTAVLRISSPSSVPRT